MCSIGLALIGGLVGGFIAGLFGLAIVQPSRPWRYTEPHEDAHWTRNPPP